MEAAVRMMSSRVVRLSASAALAAAVAYSWWRRRRRRMAKPPQLRYGTAGFRAEASLLDVAMERVGMVAALRAREVGGATGVMVTASHNAECDNGCKIVDSSGEMLAQDWETKAEALASCAEADVSRVVDGVFGPPRSVSRTAVVIVGRDTRPHSLRFASLVARGAKRMGAATLDAGECSTPQLHHCVQAQNDVHRGADGPLHSYARGLATAYEALVAGEEEEEGEKISSSRLVVDCAGGVGALSVAALAARDDLTSLELVAANGPGSDAPLNDLCGAEFVQKTKRPPRNFSFDDHDDDDDDDQKKKKKQEETFRCSVDGDADRVVFWYWAEDGSFRVLDGDKIATLLVDFLAGVVDADAPEDLKVGVVQTAYANGASTAYLKGRGVEVLRAKTGVKHLHRAAKEAFDVGVYFEANGHGTVLFSDRARQVPSMAPVAALANQVVGDALADALLVVAVLRRTNRDLRAWDRTYEDLPSVMTKVTVKDRTVLVTNDDETRLLRPIELQAAIDDLVVVAIKKHQQHAARAFVRPSGTEDIVRVYAEASTQQLADDLATHVALAVFDLANGQGDRSALLSE